MAWCAKKHTTECALKHNAKTNVKFFKANFFFKCEFYDIYIGSEKLTI